MPVKTDPQLNTRLRPETMEWVDEMAGLLEISRTEFLRRLIENLSELEPDDPARLHLAAQGVLSDIAVERNPSESHHPSNAGVSSA